ncbi:unnamed protein product, partial [Allacma fusca]
QIREPKRVKRPNSDPINMQTNPDPLERRFFGSSSSQNQQKISKQPGMERQTKS